MIKLIYTDPSGAETAVKTDWETAAGELDRPRVKMIGGTPCRPLRAEVDGGDGMAVLETEYTKELAEILLKESKAFHLARGNSGILVRIFFKKKPGERLTSARGRFIEPVRERVSKGYGTSFDVTKCAAGYLGLQTRKKRTAGKPVEGQMSLFDMMSTTHRLTSLRFEAGACGGNTASR